MTEVTNITSGPKGIHDAKGKLVMLEAGETKPVDLAKGEKPGEWFAFDGVGIPSAPATGTSADTAEHIDALTKRADEAETMLALVQDELAALKRSPPVVNAALALLDPKNDDHWTQAGEPKVDAVKAIVGGDVSRDDIKAAAPDFDRDVAKAQATT
jgi:hypothetical protein